MMKAKPALPLLLLAAAGAGAAAAGAGAATPVAWVAESEEYASLLRAKLTTPWDVRWCGANGSACVAGSDPSSAAVKAIVGRPVAGELSALPNLALVQGASWFQEYPQADVPLRSAIAYADEYPSPVRAPAPRRPASPAATAPAAATLAFSDAHRRNVRAGARDRAPRGVLHRRDL